MNLLASQNAREEVGTLPGHISAMRLIAELRVTQGLGDVNSDAVGCVLICFHWPNDN